jgi:hypothetical protein
MQNVLGIHEINWIWNSWSLVKFKHLKCIGIVRQYPLWTVGDIFGSNITAKGACNGLNSGTLHYPLLKNVRKVNIFTKVLFLFQMVTWRQRRHTVCEHGKNFGFLISSSYSHKQTPHVTKSSLSSSLLAISHGSSLKANEYLRLVNFND